MCTPSVEGARRTRSSCSSSSLALACRQIALGIFAIALECCQQHQPAGGFPAIVLGDALCYYHHWMSSITCAREIQELAGSPSQLMLIPSWTRKQMCRVIQLIGLGEAILPQSLTLGVVIALERSAGSVQQYHKSAARSCSNAAKDRAPSGC